MGNLRAGRCCSQGESSVAMRCRTSPARTRRLRPYAHGEPELSETSTCREPLRLMAVHAHPDDESSKGAATMAQHSAEGVQVLVVTCTGGERGDILNPA